MTFKRFGGAVVLGVTMLIGSGVSAQAAYTVTLTQQGPNVVASGSGTLDLTGLSLICNGCDAYTGYMIPSAEAQFLTGAGKIDGYSGASGPTSFGSGGITFANSNSGDIVGVLGAVPGEVPGEIEVPHSYAFGNPLSDTSTYNSATFIRLSA